MSDCCEIEMLCLKIEAARPLLWVKPWHPQVECISLVPYVTSHRYRLCIKAWKARRKYPDSMVKERLKSRIKHLLRCHSRALWHIEILIQISRARNSNSSKIELSRPSWRSRSWQGPLFQTPHIHPQNHLFKAQLGVWAPWQPLPVLTSIGQKDISKSKKRQS